MGDRRSFHFRCRVLLTSGSILSTDSDGTGSRRSAGRAEGLFALATAAAAAGRVSAVGVISGGGPFQEIPGALARLSGGDAEGAALSASDPDAAAAAFAGTFADLAAVSDEAQLLAAFRPALSERDQRVLASPPIAEALLRDIQEAFRQGSLGGGWDNVSWVGAWDFTLDAVQCPVLLWYGDLMAPPSFGSWLAAHLPNARLTMRRGYGHLAAIEHLSEMLDELTAPNGTRERAPLTSSP
jgi:pimeloyl-ACP methyl ester carboxylesterase